MNCSGCGAVVPEGATACPACGRPVMVPPPSSSAPRLGSLRRVASTTMDATKDMASDMKKTGKVVVGEMKIAARDVGALTRKVVDEVGKGLDEAAQDLRKAGKKGK